MSFKCFVAGVVLVATITACHDKHNPTGPQAPTFAGFPGFDIGVYPGDATMAAWRFPASPYHWVGYYLAAPCHRDVTWMGQYAKVTSMGWGTAVLYVGQQDWARIPDIVAASRRATAAPSAAVRRSVESAKTGTVSCSATLLSAAQGTTEAADAVAKTASEGVPIGSAIFLDVEYVTNVSPALVDYMSAWIAAVLADGRYRPAIYCATFNAPEIHAAAAATYATAGRNDAPPFWIAAAAGFATTSAPTDVGLAYATVWQGRFNVAESWGGIQQTIDVDVASTPSPSSPSSP